MTVQDKAEQPWKHHSHLSPMPLEPVSDVDRSLPYRAIITGQTKEKTKHPKYGPAPVVTFQVQIFEKY